MTHHKFICLKNNRGLYAEVCIDSANAEKKEDTILDRCDWTMVKATYNDARIGDGYIKWKEAVIKGIHFGLSRIESYQPRTIILIDVNGHPSHSNLHSMFAAGVTSVFKEFNICLSDGDSTFLQQFVCASFGIDDIWTEPDENKLSIAHYKA